MRKSNDDLHVRLNVKLINLFPRYCEIGNYTDILCESYDAEAQSDEWGGVTCPFCGVHPTFKRAKAIFESIYDLPIMKNSIIDLKKIRRKIPNIEIFIVSPGVDQSVITGDMFSAIFDYALLPARYYLWIREDGWRLNVEAWGSRIDGASLVYFDALRSLSLPFEIYKYGEEPSRSICQVRQVDVLSGEVRTSWKYDSGGN